MSARCGSPVGSRSSRATCPPTRSRVVDSAVSRMIATEAAGRVLEVAEAKIIEADTDLHEERCEAERRDATSASAAPTSYGLRTLIARLEAGDAVAVDAIVHRVARDHRAAPPRRHPRRAPRPRLRVARPPRRALHPPARAHRARARPGSSTSTEPEQPARAFAFPADLLDALRDSTSPRSRRRPCSTSTFTRPPSTAPRRRRPGRGLRPGHPHPAHRAPAPLATSRSSRSRTSPTGSATPPTSTPSPCATRSTSSPAATTGPTPASTSRKVDLDHPTPYDHGGRRRRPRSPAGPDRLPQLRPPRPTTPPLEDPRGLPVTPVRRRSLRLAHPARPRLPRRPHRHPPHPPREGPDDPRRARGRRHLSLVGAARGADGSARKWSLRRSAGQRRS